MTITINGTTGIAGVDGSAGTPAVQGNDTNTGIFFPAADTIAFAEGGTEVMRLDSSANLRFNSGYGSVAVAYGCRAWVNFNGTGTVAIHASGNVTSITDNDVGAYTINFTTAMPDANYAVIGTAGASADTAGNELILFSISASYSTGSVKIRTSSAAEAAADRDDNCVAIFR